MNSDLAVIIPLHQYDKKRLDYAIESFLAQQSKAKLFLSGPASVLDKIQYPFAIKIIENEDTSYQNLCNVAIKKIQEIEDISWISILEYDDAYTKRAFTLFDNYRKAYSEMELETKLWAGLTILIKDESRNTESQKMVGMVNEAMWAGGMAEEAGIFDLNAILRNSFMFVNGCFIHKSVFEEVGYFKPSMKAFYDYEFAIRMIYNGIICRSIPKLTHKHYVREENSAQSTIKSMSEDERTFWLSMSKREYFYEEDRNVQYTKNEKEEEILG
ncbi:MAG: hypothetical protein ACFFG0_18940 [Candidatus Thorarchaeota archaeon]